MWMDGVKLDNGSNITAQMHKNSIKISNTRINYDCNDELTFHSLPCLLAIVICFSKKSTSIGQMRTLNIKLSNTLEWSIKS